MEYLRPSYRMYILSNGFREVQFKKLCNSGLAPYFKRMILSEDACIQKPHKEIFDFALKNTNSRRSESLMIGDSWEADIIVAHYPLNIFSEIPFYRLSLYISYLQMFSFGLNTHEISRF